jgi:hypothetical protein
MPFYVLRILVQPEAMVLVSPCDVSFLIGIIPVRYLLACTVLYLFKKNSYTVILKTAKIGMVWYATLGIFRMRS